MNQDSTISTNVQHEISDPAVMANTPLVSVNMITYNHGPYLAEAIEGVIAQKTDFPIELIIGEDCSTDHTREIALDYQRRYPHLIRVIYSDKNVGMHENFRRVLDACRGEFIALCEGDDYWIDPLKLSKQLSFLKKELTAVMCAHRVSIIIENNLLDVGVNDKYIPKYKSSFIDILSNRFIPTCSLIFLKKALPSFLPEWFFKINSADLALELMLAYKGDCIYIDQAMACYRRHQGGATQSNNFKKYEIKLQKKIKLLVGVNDFTNNKYEKSIYKKILKLYVFLIAFYLKNMKFKESFSCINKFIKYKPYLLVSEISRIPNFIRNVAKS